MARQTKTRTADAPKSSDLLPFSKLIDRVRQHAEAAVMLYEAKRRSIADALMSDALAVGGTGTLRSLPNQTRELFKLHAEAGCWHEVLAILDAEHSSQPKADRCANILAQRRKAQQMAMSYLEGMDAFTGRTGLGTPEDGERRRIMLTFWGSNNGPGAYLAETIEEGIDYDA